MRAFVEYRFVLSFALPAMAAGMGRWPWPSEAPILGFIHERRPELYAVFQYAYSTAWFTTSLIAFNVVLSLVYIFAARWDREAVAQQLPPYPPSNQRADLFVVLGEQ